MRIKLTEDQTRRFLNEVLGDEIPQNMRDIIQKRYKRSDKYLKMDIPKHTDVIPNVKIEFDDEKTKKDTVDELRKNFAINIVEQFHQSKIYKMLLENATISYLIYKSIDLYPVNPTTDRQIPNTEKDAIDRIKRLTWLYSKNFRLPVGTGNDILDIKFSNNKSGIGTFLKIVQKIFSDDLNRQTSKNGQKNDNNFDVNELLNDKHFVGLRDPIVNYQTNIREVVDAKLYLYISDKPDDKLRMSISSFYDSCQNIYKGDDAGTQYNSKLLSNVFDENSKIAYIMFDSQFRDKKGNIHPFTPIARTILRVNNKGGVMFDAVYPREMENTLYSVIEEKTGLKNVGQKGDVYHYKGIGLPSPYMDKYKLRNVGERGEIENERLDILLTLTDVDPKDIEIISDTNFRLGEEEWVVYTHDEAIEHARDYYSDSFNELFSDMEFMTVIDYKLINKESIMSILQIDEDNLEEEGWELDEYINNAIGINTVSDFNEILKRQINSTWSWYQNNIIIENLFYYLGGEHEAIESSIGSYDGNLEEVGDYLVARIQ